MKSLICFALLLSSVLSAQEVVGTYILESSSDDFELRRTLTLNDDETFEYYNFRRVENGIPPETHIYGKGTWSLNKKGITFSTDVSDLDDKFTLDFSRTKARFISKSPRDKSDKVVKTSIRFYASEISWITGMTVIKQ